MGKYDDIINLPHHVSATRPHMPILDRAAQFMPFRALSGYEDAVQETARLTDEKVELTEDEKALLDARLQRLADEISSQPKVSLTYFQPDKKKTGGAYVCVTGQLKKIDDLEGALILLDGKRVLIEDVVDIQ
ncbi:MAG: YolD-like family protein [Oscillospiraceae bacterium]|nr:YolD-like family protein [Oscillospiraceae bacterium]